jgi:multicomponent Na+:H+ antiporter subunit D
LQAGVADGSPLALTLVAGGVITSLLTLLAVARVWTRAFWRPASQEPLADTAAAAASDAGAEVREPVPVGAGDPEGGEAQPTVRQAAWSAAWQRHEDVATAGTSVPATRAASVRALRPLPAVMVGATAVMVAVTVALTVIAGPLYGYTDRAARDLLERTPYIEAVFDGPVPAEEGE